MPKGIYTLPEGRRRGRAQSRLSLDEAEAKGLCVNCRIRPHREERKSCSYCADAVKKWRAKNPTRITHLRIQARAKKLDITLEAYQQLIVQQRGQCKICDTMAKLVMDHDHDTGVFRGLICTACNMRLGVVDDRAWMKKAIAYLSD